MALQARLADATTAEEEVTALATFLGVSVPAGMTFPLSPTFGDTSVLTSEQALRTRVKGMCAPGSPHPHRHTQSMG